MKFEIKMCDTCAYSDGKGEFAKCKRSGKYCDNQRRYDNDGLCNMLFSGWVSARTGLTTTETEIEALATKPRRRSVRQWFYDVFWRIDPPTPPEPRIPTRKFDFNETPLP
jgi:hypothetical protein